MGGLLAGAGAAIPHMGEEEGPLDRKQLARCDTTWCGAIV